MRRPTHNYAQLRLFVPKCSLEVPSTEAIEGSPPQHSETVDPGLGTALDMSSENDGPERPDE